MGNSCTVCCKKLTNSSFNDDEDLPKYGSIENHSDFIRSSTKEIGVRQHVYPRECSSLFRDPNQLAVNGNVGLVQSIEQCEQLLNANVAAAAMAGIPASGDLRFSRYNGLDYSSGRKRMGATPDHSETMLSSIYTQSSVSNLQHIAEREPEDFETDPSLHPTKETLFMQSSVREIEANNRKRLSMYDRSANRKRQRTANGMRRYSSSSTVLLDDSTVSRPEPKSTVRALAQAIYLQIKHRDRRYTSSYMPEIFDERVHPVQKEPISSDYGSHDPDQKVVYRFIRNLFQMAQLSPECAIVTMVYLERLLTSAESELTPATWKRVVLCAILLASKVWDDQAVWNVDYCQILRDLDINDVNKLERQFLEIIQFNINVPSSVYAKYYFAIRSLCTGCRSPVLLSVERAQKLEAYSRVMNDGSYGDLHKQGEKRRWHSLDSLDIRPPFHPAVLS